MFKQPDTTDPHYTEEQIAASRDYVLGKKVTKPAAVGKTETTLSMVKKALELVNGEDIYVTEARRVLGAVYGDMPVLEAEVQELAEKVRERLTGKPSGGTRPGNIENAKLKSYIERIERLLEEKAGLAQDVKDVFSEAKSNGMDVKTMRQILKLRKMKTSDRTEQEYLLDLYKRALGMQPSFDFEDEEGA